MITNTQASMLLAAIQTAMCYKETIRANELIMLGMELAAADTDEKSIKIWREIEIAAEWRL